jgi:hypothetical protein
MEEPTEVFVQGFFGLHVILFQFIVEFLQSFEVLYSNAHLFDFLRKIID